MLPPARVFVLIGSVNMALAVILGAFGSHALKARISPEKFSVFQTGNQYHIYHAIGLFAVAFVAACLPSSRLVKWSGWLMLAGILCFSGSLYILSLSGVRWFGAIIPVGGMALIVSWIFLAIGVWKK
ncbi:MAG: DUF423 domain-containing protein [Candidatus Brocadiaceae bacterium]|nr:DUF423 domain-containing protein [Candidatus Brocadiaceae bacterium]